MRRRAFTRDTVHSGMMLALLIALCGSSVLAQASAKPAPTLAKIDGEQVSFSYFTHFAASTTGALAVAQQQDGKVLFFSPDGASIG